MESRPWELLLLDWNETGRDGKAVDPSDVLRMLRATNEEEATDAYWRLDGLVCANGITYAAAVPVTQVILSALPTSSALVRERCLELLGQIAAGKSSSSSRDVVAECCTELRQMSWYFLNGLQYDRVENVWRYVDVISLLADAYPDFRGRAIMYLERALDRSLAEVDRRLISNVLASYRLLE